MRRFVAISIILSVSLFSAEAFAGVSSFEAISFKPAGDGGRYFTLFQSTNLEKWQWTAGTTFDYAYHPFQATARGGGDEGILDGTFIEHFYGTIGFLDKWLQVGFELPAVYWADFKNPNVAGSVNTSVQALGDLQLNLKSEILGLDRSPVGLAIQPFITIPLGGGKYYLGNGNFTGGGNLVIDVRPFKRVTVAANLGITIRNEYILRDLNADDEFNYGLAAAIDLTKRFSGIIEFTGNTRLSAPFEESVESPMEIGAGLKYALGKTGLAIHGGGTGGISYASGAPAFRAFGGLTFVSPTREERHERLVTKVEPINRTVINFALNDSKIDDQRYTAEIAKVANILTTNRGVKVRITGYADSTGSAATNELLSKRRAATLNVHLVGLGIDPSRIEIVGRGESGPIADNRTTVGRAANRRVTIEVLGSCISR